MVITIGAREDGHITENISPFSSNINVQCSSAFHEGKVPFCCGSQDVVKVKSKAWTLKPTHISLGTAFPITVMSYQTTPSLASLILCSQEMASIARNFISLSEWYKIKDGTSQDRERREVETNTSSLLLYNQGMYACECALQWSELTCCSVQLFLSACHWFHILSASSKFDKCFFVISSIKCCRSTVVACGRHYLLWTWGNATDSYLKRISETYYHGPSINWKLDRQGH